MDFDPASVAILIAPHPALKRRARPVAEADLPLLRQAVPAMFEAMYAAPGIGLAAPQIGLGLRLVVIDLQPEDRREPLVLVNPEIVDASEEGNTYEEGCLSLPGQYAEITRPKSVSLRYLDAELRPRALRAEGLLATCAQHEIDHLNGVLFVDHLSPLKRNVLLRRLAKARRGGPDADSRRRVGDAGRMG